MTPDQLPFVRISVPLDGDDYAFEAHLKKSCPSLDHIMREGDTLLARYRETMINDGKHFEIVVRQLESAGAVYLSSM